MQKYGKFLNYAKSAEVFSAYDESLLKFSMAATSWILSGEVREIVSRRVFLSVP